MSISISPPPYNRAAVRQTVMFPGLPPGWIVCVTNDYDRLEDKHLLFYYYRDRDPEKYKSQYEPPEHKVSEPGVSGHGNMTADTRYSDVQNFPHFGDLPAPLQGKSRVYDSHVYHEKFPGDIPPDLDIADAILNSQLAFESSFDENHSYKQGPPYESTGTSVDWRYMHPYAEQARLRRNEESETPPSPSPSPSSTYPIYFGDGEFDSFDSRPEL